VGCLTRDPAGGHAKYPKRWGIPEELAWLEDTLFEHLPEGLAWVWPERFLVAIPVGADLSGVYAAWSATVMLDPERGNTTRCGCFLAVEAVVRRVGALWRDNTLAVSDAWSDAWSDAESDAELSELETQSAASALWAVVSAGWSTRCVTRSASWPAAYMAEAAARSAESREDLWPWLADRLIACLAKAPVVVAS